MSTAATQVNSTEQSATLALYLGETYLELEIKSTVPKAKAKSIFKKNYFLPQSSLKTTLAQVQKQVIELGVNITDVYIVCRYFERLKTFRLGGSVVQVVHRGFENSYTLENTSRVSLAASSLVISVDKKITTEFLTTELARIKKINPDANKVAIELDPNLISADEIQIAKDFFTELSFKIFNCENPQDLLQVRKTLLNAGSEGTKEEIVSELKENFKDVNIYFWVKNKFCKTESTEFENFDLYFSSQDFLTYLLKLSKKLNLIHFDLESWFILNSETKNIWDSPWGLISRTYNQTSSVALHPLTEILIDETSRLQFSKSPASSEPGPMIAGRGVKSLLIDLYWQQINQDDYFKTLFPQLSQPLLQTKIESQFKVLEKGQRSESKELSKDDLIAFVNELIDFELELKLGHSVSQIEKTICTGHLAQLVHPKTKPFSWTENIFEHMGQV